MENTYTTCTDKEEEKAEGKEVCHEDRDEEEEGDERDNEEGVMWLGGGLSGGRVRRVRGTSRGFGSGV